MPVRPLNLTVNGRLTIVRIEVQTDGNHLVLQGVLEDQSTGQAIQSFTEDVTSLLTPAQKGALTNIVSRAQAWIDSK